MPIGKPFPTNAAVVKIATLAAPATIQLLGLGTGWDTDVAEDLNEVDVLAQADPVQNLGREKMHLNVSLLLSDSTDDGQSIYEANKISRGQVWVHVLWDGTNGFKAKATPTGRKSTGKAGNGWVEAQFAFAIQPSTMVAVGTGPTI